jgi:hypothetical protein
VGQGQAGDRLPDEPRILRPGQFESREESPPPLGRRKRPGGFEFGFFGHPFDEPTVEVPGFVGHLLDLLEGGEARPPAVPLDDVAGIGPRPAPDDHPAEHPAPDEHVRRDDDHVPLGVRVERLDPLEVSDEGFGLLRRPIHGPELVELAVLGSEERPDPPSDPGLAPDELGEPEEDGEHPGPESEFPPVRPIPAGDDFEEIGRQADPREQLPEKGHVHVNPRIEPGRHPAVVEARRPGDCLEDRAENVLDDRRVFGRPNEGLDDARGHIGDDAARIDASPR